MFDEQGEEFITHVLVEVPDTNGVELVAAYTEEFGITVGVRTMNEKLRRMGYTREKESSVHQLPSESTLSQSGKPS